MPWILVFFSVDDVFRVYRDASISAVIYSVGFGFLWGIGSVLFGLGVAIVGNALGFAIILVRCGRCELELALAELAERTDELFLCA